MFNKIFVHVGLDKTGSSYLQSSLEYLAKGSLLKKTTYPLENPHDDFLKIRSGNGEAISLYLLEASFREEKLEQLTQGLLASADQSKENLLISGEHFCRASSQRFNYFLQLLEKHAAAVEVILFVRPVAPIMRSRYHQQVKRHAEAREYCDDFIAEYAQELIDKVIMLGNLEHKLHIVDYCRSGLLKVLLDLLGEDCDAQLEFNDSLVNRSLTATELQLLRTINSVFKDIHLSAAISDRWLYKWPAAISAQLTVNAGSELAIFKDSAADQSEQLASSECQQLLAGLMVQEQIAAADGNPQLPAAAEQPINLVELLHEALEVIAKLSHAYKNLRKQTQSLALSKDMFDPVHYLLINEDVLCAGVDPLQHYKNHGAKEGRYSAYSNIAMFKKI